jgi:hypothetical protein
MDRIEKTGSNIEIIRSILVGIIEETSKGALIGLVCVCAPPDQGYGAT